MEVLPKLAYFTSKTSKMLRYSVMEPKVCQKVSAGKRKLKNNILEGIMLTALQIRGSQRKITTNLRSLAANIYHVIIIVTGRFSKKSFFLLFPRNCFEQSTCFHGIETLLQNSQNKFVFFLSVHFFTLFPNHSVY